MALLYVTATSKASSPGVLAVPVHISLVSTPRFVTTSAGSTPPLMPIGTRLFLLLADFYRKK